MVITRIMDTKMSKTPTGTKAPPHNLDAEESVLGAILLEGDFIRKVINTLKDDDFYSDRNRWVYLSAKSLYSRAEKINQISVSQELDRLERLQAVGGSAYIANLIGICESPLDIEHHARIISRLGVARRMITLSENLSALGYAAQPDANESISKADELLAQFKKDNLQNSNKLITPVMAGNDIAGMLDKYAKPAHVPSWGFRDMDNLTAGIFPEYIIFGARPSVGKTQLMLDISENVSMQKRKILFVSAEMNKDQIYERKLARKINMGILDLRKHGLSGDQNVSVATLAGEVYESNSHYLAGGIYLRDIYREASIMLDKGGLDMIFIDYIGALKDCYDDRDNQNVRISRISNKIQDMVHEFHIPIAVASQLNREIEHRGGMNTKEKAKSTPPQLSDLRDSGSIEQDADVVFLLHREEDDKGNLSNILKVCMKKNRQLGSAKHIDLAFNYNLRRYVDVAYESP